MRLSPEQGGKEIKITQIKLPIEEALIKESGEDPTEWINKYGERLDEILRDPELQNLLDEKHHEELKEKVRQRLYH